MSTKFQQFRCSRSRAIVIRVTNRQSFFKILVLWFWIARIIIDRYNRTKVKLWVFDVHQCMMNIYWMYDQHVICVINMLQGGQRKNHIGHIGVITNMALLSKRTNRKTFQFSSQKKNIPIFFPQHSFHLTTTKKFFVCFNFHVSTSIVWEM